MRIDIDYRDSINGDNFILDKSAIIIIVYEGFPSNLEAFSQ